MHRSAVRVVALLAALAGGCAHHKANQYAYAPPLAPPVYPQPQGVAPPVVAPAPGPIVAAPALPAGPVATGAPLTATGGEIPANPDGSCPPCVDGSGAVPVVYEGAVQTQPCPPGP